MMTTSVLYGDLFRLTGLIVGGIALSAAAIVAFTYAKEYRLHLLTARGPQDKWRGLLPRHVVLIAISHIGLIMVTMWEITFERLHTDFTWRAPTLLALYASSMFAMFDVRSHQKHRKYSRPGEEEIPWPTRFRLKRDKTRRY